MIVDSFKLPKSLRIRFAVCAFLCLSAAFAVLVLRRLDIRDGLIPLRVIASSSFIAASLLKGWPASRYGRGVVVFLAFCQLGDIFGPVNFLLGVFFFLIAHIILWGAIQLHGIQWRRFFVAAGIVLVVNSGIYWAFAANMQTGERIWILAYTVVIGLMLAAAAALDAPPIRWLTLFAAILFWISDIALGLTRYTGAGYLFTVTGYPIYYVSCLVFALSALKIHPIHQQHD